MLTESEMTEFYKHIVNGQALEYSIKQVNPDIDPKDLSYWLLTDESRRNMYYQMQQLGIEQLVDFAMSKAEDTSIDPVDRQIVLNAVKFVAQTRSRERYGAHVKHENTFTVDLTDAMDKAEKRLIETNPVLDKRKKKKPAAIEKKEDELVIEPSETEIEVVSPAEKSDE